MTRAEIIALIIKITGIERHKSDTIVLEFLISIISALEAHEAVFIKGFETLQSNFVTRPQAGILGEIMR